MPLYFESSDGTHGLQLWEKNAAGASLMLTTAGSDTGFSGGIADLTPYNGLLFFAGYDGAHQDQLWVSNGATAGTQMLTSDDIGNGGLGISDPTVYGGEFYFAGYDSVHGTQLWGSNGTAAGTVMLTDINSLTATISSLTGLNGKLYFVGDDRLWVSNGTASGTSVVTTAVGMTSLVPVGSELYFVGYGGEIGAQLWESDGTAAGTHRLTYVNTNPDAAGEVFGLGVSNMTVAGDTLFFVGDDGTDGPQLWASNSSGTSMLTLTDTGDSIGSSDAFGLAMSNFTVLNGKLFFTADDDLHGPQLWVSDGTAAGTGALTNIDIAGGEAGAEAAGFGESSFTARGIDVFFVGNDGMHGSQLWATSGGAPAMLTNDSFTEDGELFGLTITNMTAVNGKLFFVGADATHATQIWVSDGTAAGTKMLTQTNWVYPNVDGVTSNSPILNVFSFNGDFYFVGDDGVHGWQLWVTNGTAAGTVMLTANDLAGGGFSPFSFSEFTVADGKLDFAANDSIHGTQLWATDGTTVGTAMVTNVSGFTTAGIQDVTPAAPEVHANLDGHALSDILIENTVGAVDAGELGSGGMFAYNAISSLGPEWSFGGVGDYYGDGKSQFLIENTSSAVDIGEVGASGTAVYTAVSALGPEWRFVGSGDFLGLGKSEFLIENTVGAVDVGTVSSSKTTSYTPVATLASQWSVVESGDFYGDGKTQFLIESTAGVVEVGEVGSNNQAALVQVAALGPEWRFVGAGDFLGIGKDQVLIENTAGAVDVGTVGSNNTVTYTAVASLGPEWKFVGDGDYYGTGTASFLIENTSGAVDTGTVVNGKALYATVAALGSEWSFGG
jgi:ELWxxDGT repeat protein